jgi:hypothetical protein
MSEESKKELTKEQEYEIVILKKMRWKNAMLDEAWALETRRRFGKEYVR